MQSMPPHRHMRIDVTGWPRERYLALLFAILVACAWMLSSAARGHASLRRRHFAGLATWTARSPVPYLATVGAAARLRPQGAGERPPLRLVVRADSAGEGERGALCRLAAADGSLGREMEVAWIAFGPAVDPCVSRAAGGRLADLGGAAGDTLRAQLGGARWVLLDGQDRALYSRRRAAAPEEVRALAALLVPGREP